MYMDKKNKLYEVRKAYVIFYIIYCGDNAQRPLLPNGTPMDIIVLCTKKTV